MLVVIGTVVTAVIAGVFFLIAATIVAAQHVFAIAVLGAPLAVAAAVGRRRRRPAGWGDFPARLWVLSDASPAALLRRRAPSSARRCRP